MVSEASDSRPIDSIDIASVAEALDDAGSSMGRWYDPDTGTVAVGDYGGDPLDQNGEPVDEDDHGYAAIESTGSHEAYQDMVDFADAHADRPFSATLTPTWPSRRGDVSWTRRSRRRANVAASTSSRLRSRSGGTTSSRRSTPEKR